MVMCSCNMSLLCWLAVYGVCVSMATELASLTPAQLMEKIRALQNMAYRLGVEEGEGMERGGGGEGREREGWRKVRGGRGVKEVRRGRGRERGGGGGEGGRGVREGEVRRGKGRDGGG